MKTMLVLLGVLGIGAAAMVGQAAEPAAPEAPAGHQVLKKAKVGGEGRWDFVTVDAPGQRLFVPRSSHVMVLDVSSTDLKVVGDIPGTAGVHGVALAPKAGRGFTSNGTDGTVTVFDLKTLKALGTVKAGQGPDAIIYDPASDKVLVMNHRGGTITAFAAAADLAQPVPTTTIEVGGALEVAVVDGAGHLYVNVEDKNETVAVDTQALKVTAHWPLSGGDGPTGLAIDAKKNLLFAVCANEKMVVLDSRSGKVVTTLPIGKNVDGCACDPERELAFSSNGDGTLTIVSDHDAAHPAVAGTLPTMPGARTIDLDPTTHRLYLPTAEFTPVPAGQRGRPAPVAGSFTIVIAQ